jgi:hypothetical protein
VVADRLKMRAARDKYDIGTGVGQACSEITTDSTGSHNGNAHGALSSEQ